MDHTPSLSRSPTSPANSCCLSDISSLEYPSPDLVVHQYSISSLYGVDSFCSMAPNQDSDIPLFALGSAGQSNWNQRSMAHATSTSSAPSAMLSTEYDSFGNFGPTIPAVYPPGIYHGTQQERREAQVASSPSPAASTLRPNLMPVSRSPLSFPALSTSASRSLMEIRHHGDIEASILPYGRVASGSPFPPQRSIHLSYEVEPPGVYGAGNNAGTTNGFALGEATSMWSHATPTSSQLYHSPDGHRQQSPNTAPDRQVHGARLRRQLRRLTTKEEANFQCEVKGCGKLFSRSYNYKAHMETHDEKREYPFPCQVPDCSKRFVRKTDLQRHHQSVHMKERNHRCDYCGRLFARKDTLRR